MAERKEVKLKRLEEATVSLPRPSFSERSRSRSGSEHSAHGRSAARRARVGRNTLPRGRAAGGAPGRPLSRAARLRSG